MNVTVYGSTTCQDSAKLRNWLGQREVEYTGLLIDKNPHAASKLVQYKEQSTTPFTVIEYDDGSAKTFSGFCPQDIELCLDPRPV